MQDTDVIRFACHHCGKPIRVRENLAGKRIRCPNKECAQPLEVPVPTDVGENSPEPVK